MPSPPAEKAAAKGARRGMLFRASSSPVANRNPNDRKNARAFQSRIDSACVYVNASTRFTDGGEFGFGAEIGISTQKLHARGPLGLRELCSFKYVVRGNGQVRG